jgi:hypothetical protein
VWEQNHSKPPVQRGLALLAVTGPQESDELAKLTIGQRDERLLKLRALLFGENLAALSECPSCGACLETDLITSKLVIPKSDDAIQALTLSQDGYEIQFRLPTSLDLVALTPGSKPELARQTLAELCVIAAHNGASLVPAAQLPANVVTAVAERMSAADPQADLELAFQCPACEHSWLAPLDILSFLWLEIQAWAGRLLREIHELASAYGWGETEILALSPFRRQAYLKLIRA